MRSCQACGYENSSKARYCKRCGVSIEATQSSAQTVAQPAMPQQVAYAVPAHPPPPQPIEETQAQRHSPYIPRNLLWAGVLSIVGAVLGILMGPVIPAEFISAGLSETIRANASWTIIISILALVGGVLGLLRRAFFVSLILVLVGSFAVGPLFLTTTLCTIATILVAISRRDFIPLIALTTPQLKCTECGHGLTRTLAYREFYCFNCKQYRTLPHASTET